MLDRMKSLCVFCGSNQGNSGKFAEIARALGETAALRGVELVFGGSHVGLMGVMANAAIARGGRVIGVLPRFMADKELAHTGLTQLHVVDTMHERKQRMAELAEGFVAMPGGFGTLEEIFEAITWAQLHLHAYPCALLNVQGYYDSLVEFLRVTVAEGFVRKEQLDSLIVAADVDDLFQQFESFRPEKSEKWIPKQVI